MKVLLISGSLPPTPCGVGDYANQLYISLFTKAYSVKLFKIHSWKLINTWNVINAIVKEGPSLIHIQYPTLGYGYSLLPQLLSILFPSLVTLHEFSQAHILRKLSLSLFTVRSILIFTTSHEQESFCKFYFWIKKDKTYVLPLGSSIKSNHDFKQKKIADPLIISYFGLIRPNKGIEDFISLLDIYNKNTVTVKGRIIGKILQSEIQYARKLQTITANLPIEWCLNKSESKVSDLLFETTFTYLPYPDGASLRRSSLLAALSHATFVITTKGSQTPSGLDGIVSYADSPQKAFMVLNGFDYTTSNAEVLVHRTKRFSLAFNWEIIAESHIKLYELVLQKGHNAKAIEDLHQSSLS